MSRDNDIDRILRVPPAANGEKNTLRRMARDAIAAGRIPARPADRMWGGPGAGAICDVCEREVTDQQFGIDLEFARVDGVPLQHEIHVACFWDWELECASSSPKQTARDLSGTVTEGTIQASERRQTQH